MIKKVFRHYEHKWRIHGEDIVEDLESRGIIVDHMQVVPIIGNGQWLDIEVTDLESLTLLKLMET